MNLRHQARGDGDMINRFKNTKMHVYSLKWTIVFLLIGLVQLSNLSRATMQVLNDNDLSQLYGRGLTMMEDDELEEVTGQAFSNLTVSQNGSRYIVQANLNLDIDLYAHIEKFKMGKWSNGYTKGAKLIWPLNYQFNEGSWLSPWDINWENLQMGESIASPMKLKGMVIRADFEQTTSGKVLNRFILGSDNVSGRVYCQSMKSFTGNMNTSLAVGSNFLVEWMPPTWTRNTYILNGESHDTTEDMLKGMLGNVGKKGMQFSNHGFFIVMDKKGGIGMWAGFPLSDIDVGDPFGD